MTLNFLSKCGVTAPEDHRLSPEDLETELNSLSANDAYLAKTLADVKKADASIDAILNGLDIVTGLTNVGVESSLVAGVFGEHLDAAGIPQSVTEEVVTGCESAGADVGNESISSAKDLVMNIVNWLIGKYKEIASAITRSINGHFGSIARGLDKWRAIKTRVEGYQEEGRTAEEKGKLEVRSGAAAFCLGEAKKDVKAVVSWDDLPKHIEVVRGLSTLCEDKLGDTDLVPDVDSIENFPGDVNGIKTKATEAFPNFTKATWDTGVANTTHSEGTALLGRSVLLVQTKRGLEGSTTGDVKNADEAALRDLKRYMGGVVRGIRPCHSELKPLEEVSVPHAKLEQLLTVAEAHIELATTALTLQTSKKTLKVERAFDKAIASAKKWSNSADKSDATARREAAAAAGFMSTYLLNAQQSTLGLVADSVRLSGNISSAHASVASKMASRYKTA